MSIALDFIRIVLVETTHPGNIGAVARAMKTMGFSNLHLVNPKVFPHAEATARSSGADDILEAAKIHSTLPDAIKDCLMVFATSARTRNLSCHVLPLEEAFHEIIESAKVESHVAIVFGRESSGLTNKELDSCKGILLIPTENNFSSLNVASAVQIICYELFKKITFRSLNNERLKEKSELVTNKDLENFYLHLEQCLIDIKFLDPKKPRKLLRRLKNLFNRAELDQNEYNILRGILTAIQNRIRQK